MLKKGIKVVLKVRKCEEPPRAHFKHDCQAEEVGMCGCPASFFSAPHAVNQRSYVFIPLYPH